MTSLAFATCIACLVFTMFVTGLFGDRAGGWRMVALPMSGADRRLGFEVFAPFFSNFFALSLVVVIACLGMMMQNSYLRSATSVDIFSFMLGDFSEIAHAATGAWTIQEFWSFAWVSWFFEPFPKSWDNAQVSAGVLLFALAALVTTGTSWWLLRREAIRARELAYDNLQTLAREAGLTEDELEQRLDEMRVWPVGWTSELELLAILLCMTFAVFNYRAVFLPAAYIGFVGGAGIIKSFSAGLRARAGAAAAARGLPPPRRPGRRRP